MRLIDADALVLKVMDASLSSVDEDTIFDLIDECMVVGVGLAKYEQMKRERDEAVKNLKERADCEYCKFWDSQKHDCVDYAHDYCNEEHGLNWEWRGVQNEAD